MQVKNIEVVEVKLVKFDSRTGDMKLQISFLGESPVFAKININDSHEEMAEAIINAVKEQKRPVDYDEDEVLGGISIINVINDDDIREKIGRGVTRIEQRFENLKRTRNASEYMKAYQQVSTSDDVIYRKGC